MREEINFVGTGSLDCGGWDSIADRDRNCRFAANLVQWALKADAAVLTKFGGGVPHANFVAENWRACWKAWASKPQLLVTNLAQRTRRLESALLLNFPEVNAIVYIGGNSTTWEAPRFEKVM